jgi:hypothetical protein
LLTKSNLSSKSQNQPDCIKRADFEKAYQEQVDSDIKQLKTIGELEFNYENLTEKIATTRQEEYS